ncbi:Uu.00g032070.m01.CDS01 [Anthostomella pinea]|uniref:Uu.00g032070.m01.CDS01 n=1 Tax=Anthostomella pinea TaxID=933095 RepID=A0AAI8YAR0_9PEZI|nr:Uu.00g032070.m01.CDS01 [Anthostomella pinea]
MPGPASCAGTATTTTEASLAGSDTSLDEEDVGTIMDSESPSFCIDPVQRRRLSNSKLSSRMVLASRIKWQIILLDLERQSSPAYFCCAMQRTIRSTKIPDGREIVPPPSGDEDPSCQGAHLQGVRQEVDAMQVLHELQVQWIRVVAADRDDREWKTIIDLRYAAKQKSMQQDADHTDYWSSSDGNKAGGHDQQAVPNESDLRCINQAFVDNVKKARNHLRSLPWRLEGSIDDEDEEVAVSSVSMKGTALSTGDGRSMSAKLAMTSVVSPIRALTFNSLPSSRS